MIIIFGSINMDLVVRAPHLPVPGETLIGTSFFTAPGGKGANQAVASARLGAPTYMVGRVGGDVFGGTLRDGLAADGVDITAVQVDQDQPSGVALISVDDRGENTIVVVPGANGAVGPDDLARLEAVLDTAHVLLLQLEVPLEAVIAAARMARQRGVTVILDPAPARELPSEIYSLVDIVTPNETEAAILVGEPLHDQAAIERAAQIFHERGVRTVIIKLGERGAYWSNGQTAHTLPTFKVRAVDSVAAGDAFNGGLATALHEQRSLEEALQWALAAGALSVTKAGAQPSLPSRAEVETLVARNSLDVE